MPAWKCEVSVTGKGCHAEAPWYEAGLGLVLGEFRLGMKDTRLCPQGRGLVGRGLQKVSDPAL